MKYYVCPNQKNEQTWSVCWGEDILIDNLESSQQAKRVVYLLKQAYKKGVRDKEREISEIANDVMDWIA